MHEHTTLADPVSEQVQEPPVRRVVGLDLSLTAAGVAMLTITDDGWTSAVRTIGTEGHNDDTLTQRWQRLRDAANAILLVARTAELVLVEQPAYSKTTGKSHDRSGLWWRVIDRLIEDGITVVEVTPGQVKKYATGKGNSGKQAVLLATDRRYPMVGVTNDNEADALTLAAMGARWLATPIENTLPLTHIEAMTKVRWPE